jgi:small-conductance mechanosensitive channel
MAQAPLPEPPDSVQVPLPDAFERWRDLYLHDVGQKLLVFLGFVVLLYFVARFARAQISRHIEEVNRRHTLRKAVGYGYAGLLVLFGIALFADSLEGFGTVLALVLAGIAVALQDVLKSVVGWLYISSRSGIQVGSRVEVAGVTGDVIDIGVLKTTLLEVGNLVYGRQSTGRMVTIPNYQMLSANVFVSGADNPFVWQEVKVTVTFESDWQRAETILREIGEELHSEIAPELEVGFRRLERRYALKYGTLTPIVYLTLPGSGVELTLRFLVHARRRRGSLDRVSRRMLVAFAQEPNVRMAYPTYRVFRLGEAAPGQVGTADMHGDPRMEQGGEEGLPPPDMLE